MSVEAFLVAVDRLVEFLELGQQVGFRLVERLTVCVSASSLAV